MNYSPTTKGRPIYLDCHATTPLDERVLAAMIPYFTYRFGNCASGGHVYGWEAAAAVDRARAVLAAAINAAPEEIIFTSGATEANNLALKGVAEAYLDHGRHLVTVQTEHQAVLQTCRCLEAAGLAVTYLPVGPDGLIDLTELEQALRPDTILVSVMAANNEIGVLQPLAQIGALCRERGVLFHTDAAQALGKVPLDVENLSVDLMSLTAHKVYGPKGVGALYRRRRVRLAPQIHGGGQEDGWRSGTLAVPLIVGFAEALEWALEELPQTNQYLGGLRDKLWQTLGSLPGVYLNGHPHQRLAGNLNISVAGVDGASLLLAMQKVAAVSGGSACSSKQIKPSHVLTALGRSPALAAASLRFGLGRFNTEAQIDEVGQKTLAVIRNLRGESVISSGENAYENNYGTMVVG